MKHSHLSLLWVCIFLVFQVSGIAGAGEARMAPQPETGSGYENRLESSEYQRGFIPPPFEPHSVTTPRLPLTAAESPVRFDWREEGVVTGVRYQGSCGACYAFAGLADLESKLLIAGEGAYDFSENNLKECEFFAKNGFQPSGCNGGTYWRIVNLMAEYGTVLETCDPYLPYNAPCRQGCPYVTTVLNWRVFTLSEIPAVPLMKSYLTLKGPIFVAIDAGYRSAWKNELNNYDGSYTLHYTDSPTDPLLAVNHAVLIVGWDDTLSHAGGQGAWIAKNSWGSSWGGTAGYGTARGYLTISYGSANIGYYSSFIEDWQDYDPCGELLFYDEAGYYNQVGYDGLTAWGMCRFDLEEGADLERVEFWTTDATSDIDIYIYDDFNGSVLSNLLASELDNSYAEMGYHSVPITTPLEAVAGEDIYVAVKFSNASYPWPLTTDPAGIGPSAQGKCYISPGGDTWSLSKFGSVFADLGIRLRVHYHRDCDPPDSVSFFRAVPGDSMVSLEWMNPDDADFSHTLITYSDSDYPKIPQEGTPVENGFDGKFYEAPFTEDSFLHTGRVNDVTYYYSAFAADTAGNYSGPMTGVATPGDAVPPGQITLFTAEGSDRSVELGWIGPDDEDLAGVRIRYSTEAAPLSLEEGMPVENGSDGVFDTRPGATGSFTHSGLTNDSSYHYTIWAFDGMQNHSPAQNAQAIPIDNKGPEFEISIMQNPYLSNHLDIYVIASEEIIDISLVVTVGGEEVDVSPVPGEDPIFRHDYEIYTSGAVDIRACATDLNMNHGCTPSLFAASRISSQAGGSAASVDGRLNLAVPAGLLGVDTYVLIGESSDKPLSMLSLYKVSPTLTALAGRVSVSIYYGDDVPEPDHLCIARVENGEIHPLESYLDRGQGRVVAYVDRLGAFGLFERPDIETPPYGGGDLTVFPNTPNPFSSSTGIRFALPEARMVRVRVFSADGRLVRSLLDRTLEPGRHTVRWDGTDETGTRVAGGIYFVRISTPAASATGKMVLLR